MLTRNPLLFLACIFLALPSFITGQNAPVVCNENDRVAVCPQIFDPVCALANTQCFIPPCPTINVPFPNGCFACKDIQVQSWTLGDCDAVPVTATEEAVLEEAILEEENLLIVISPDEVSVTITNTL